MTAALKLMTADEFLSWRLDHKGTWELVDGVPVEKFYNGPNMMFGASRNHGMVTTNIILALGQKLRGGPCHPIGGQFAVRIHARGVRQPDVLVECGAGRGDDLEATEARVIFEVLSPSTPGRRFGPQGG
jgi:Uma2 family endonuclease